MPGMLSIAIIYQGVDTEAVTGSQDASQAPPVGTGSLLGLSGHERVERSLAPGASRPGRQAQRGGPGALCTAPARPRSSP